MAHLWQAYAAYTHADSLQPLAFYNDQFRTFWGRLVLFLRAFYCLLAAVAVCVVVSCWSFYFFSKFGLFFLVLFEATKINNK